MTSNHRKIIDIKINRRENIERIIDPREVRIDHQFIDRVSSIFKLQETGRASRFPEHVFKAENRFLISAA